MKRGHFIILFLLIAFVFVYSDSSLAEQVRPTPDSACSRFNTGNCPPDKCKIITGEITETFIGCTNKKTVQSCVENSGGDFCYPENTPNLFDLRNPPNVKVDLKYEGVSTAGYWELNIASRQLNVKKLSGNKVVNAPLSLEESPLSTEKCKVYTFDFKREGGVLSLDMPKSREMSLRDGTRLCLYVPTKYMLEELVSLGGVPTSLSQICPDLQAGRPLENPGLPCPETARCDITVNQGEPASYGLTYDKDNCGKVVVGKLNDGNPIPSGDNSFAESFVRSCSEKYEKEKKETCAVELAYDVECSCKDTEAETLINAYNSNIEAIQSYTNLDSNEDLEMVKQKLIDAVKMYKARLNEQSVSSSEFREIELELGKDEFLLSKIELQLGKSDIRDFRLSEAYSHYINAEASSNPEIKSEALLGMALYALETADRFQDDRFQDDRDLEKSLEYVRKSLEVNSNNENARELLRNIQIGILEAIYDRLTENARAVLDFNLLDETWNIPVWREIRLGFGDTVDVYRMLYLQWVAGIEEQQSEIAVQLLRQQGGVNMMMNFVRNGGDITQLYSKVNSPNEFESYVKSVFPNKNNIDAQEYSSLVMSISEQIQEAMKNPDVSLLVRNGEFDNSQNNIDLLGNPKINGFLFKTERGYIGDTRFQVRWYDKVSNQLTFSNAASFLAPGVRCAKLGLKVSLGEYVSSKTIWQIPALRNLGSASGSALAFGTGIIATEGLARVDMPRPLAEFVGGLVVFAPPGAAKVWRELAEETVHRAPDEVVRILNRRGISDTDGVYNFLVNNIHTRSKQGLLADLRSVDPGFPEAQLDEILETAYAKAQLNKLARTKQLDDLINRQLSDSNIVSRGTIIGSGVFGDVYTLPEYPNTVFKVLYSQESNIYTNSWTFVELKNLRVMSDFPELAGKVPRITMVGENGKWFAMSKVQGRPLKDALAIPADGITTGQREILRTEIMHDIIDLEKQLTARGMYYGDFQNGRNNILIEVVKDPVTGEHHASAGLVDFGIARYDKKLSGLDLFGHEHSFRVFMISTFDEYGLGREVNNALR